MSNNNAIIYCRISTGDKTGMNYSLNNQLVICRDYCTQNNLNIVRTVNEIVTGRNMENYDTLTKIINESQSGTKIIVSSVSRFSRNLLKALEVLNEMTKRGISIYCVKENLEYSSPLHKFMFHMMLTLSEFESDQISDRIQTSVNLRKQKGDSLGQPKYGYEIYYETGIRKMRRNHQEYNLARRIYTRLENNTKPLDLANELNNEGLSFRNKAWNSSRINYVKNIYAQSINNFSETFDSDRISDNKRPVKRLKH